MLNRVLVVDDNFISRSGLQNLLVANQWQVSLAKNGVQALQLCDKQQFDVIVTGFSMPMIDGPHLLELLKSQAKYKDVPIVMLSTRSQQQVAAITDMAKLAFFMKKPLEPRMKQQLLERLAAIVVATNGKAA